MLNMGVASSFVWRSENTADQSQDIYYTVDGSEPDALSVKYTEPVPMPAGGHIKARAIVENRMGPVTEIRLGILPKGWTAADSDGRTDEPGRVLDGNPYRGWISEGSSKPHFLTVDMKQEHAISGFTYLPARGGFIESFEVEVSTDGQNWKRIHRGTFGNIINDPGRRVVLFDEPVSARYFKLSNLTPPGSYSQVGAGELQILSGK
ncbi:MAG TPA: hypothetical protein ENN90_00070, partial [Mariniphaga anaerophila]|nr:hypothetical protein [Mariniphaga anaerophila]